MAKEGVITGRNNPYTLTFGKEPAEYIERFSDTQKVMEDFLSEEPSQQVYMITGVRGSGKTVFMSNISDRLEKKSDWVIIDLNPNSPDMIRSAAAFLCSNNEFAVLFQNARLNFSLLGFGLEVSNAVPIADNQVALDKMIQQISRHGNRKILFTIDEVTVSDQMRSFAFAFQQFLRRKYPVYMIMTGLYENISDLQDEKNLTFLYRAPKIMLSRLNPGAMAANYAENLHIADSDAGEMARLTRGYPFAFQVMGYFYLDTGGNYNKTIRYTRQYLEEQAYEKIWAEMSLKDRELAKAIASVRTGRVKDIKEYMHIEQNELNPYRKRLIRKGVAESPIRGYLAFTLPFFEQFVLEA